MEHVNENNLKMSAINHRCASRNLRVVLEQGTQQDFLVIYDKWSPTPLYSCRDNVHCYDKLNAFIDGFDAGKVAKKNC